MAKFGRIENVFEKASSFAVSVTNYVFNGMINVDKESKDKRLEICRSCDKYTESSMGPQCKECGCLLNIKTGWASEECPLKKWLAEKSAPKSDCGSCNK